MFKSLKATLKHSIIYGLGNISSKLVGFILLPLYTQYLTIDEYGVLAILEVTSQILVSVFSFNISTAMLRWCAETSNLEQQKKIVFTTLISTSVISILLSVMVLPFTSELSKLFFGSNKFSHYIILLFLTSSLGIHNLFPLTLMRLREKSSLFAILNSVKFALTLLLNIYFISYLNMGVEGILISLLIGQLFLSLISIPLVKQNIVLNFQFSILKEMISYGLPLVFTTVFSLLLTMSDRFVIKYFNGDASVGIYSLGYKIASVSNVIILQSFQLGFLPIAYKKVGSADSQRFFSKTLTYYTFILILVGLGISFFSKELIEILAKKQEYWESYSVIPIISLAFVLKGIQYIYSLSFHYSKRTSYNAAIVIISSLLNVALNIVLVDEFGYIGAAYAILIATLFMMWLSYHYGQKVYYINYETKKLYLLIILGILFYLISILLNDLNIYLSLFTKLLLFCAFPFVLLPFNFYEVVELKRINQGWHKWKNPFNWKNNFKKISQ